MKQDCKFQIFGCPSSGDYKSCQLPEWKSVQVYRTILSMLGFGDIKTFKASNITELRFCGTHESDQKIIELTSR